MEKDTAVLHEQMIVHLNRLLVTQRCSLVGYLSKALFWTHQGNEALVKAIRGITDDQEHYADRLTEAIEERNGRVESTIFPMAFMSLNDLALDYRLTRLIEYQRRDIQVIQQCAAEPSKDTLARSLGDEILRSSREHLEILKSFLIPQSPSGDATACKNAKTINKDVDDDASNTDPEKPPGNLSSVGQPYVNACS
jgi:bacterioferritin (cytochrome b1)